MLEILLLIDGVLGLLTVLDNTTRNHNALYLRVLPGCMKPKVHYNRHVVDHMRRHSVHISCLPAERKDKEPNQSVAHGFGRFNQTLLTQEAYLMAEGFKHGRLYEHIVWAPMLPFLYHYDRGWQVLVGRGMCPTLVQAQSSQCGNIHLHSNRTCSCVRRASNTCLVALYVSSRT